MPLYFGRSHPRPTIQFDQEEPYKPGDTVTGTATLTLLNDTRARSVIVYWKGRGFERVNPPRNNLRKTWTSLHNGTVFWEEAGEVNKVFAGTHSYQFSFKLPEGIHSSYYVSNELAATYLVKYYVKIVLDVPWSFGLKTKKYFHVTGGASRKVNQNSY